MYKLLLCWRYLRTRYLALACVVSVMLGVATLIVVNSVMSGFSSKLRDRLHEVMSDITVETQNMEGFDGYEQKMQQISEDPVLKDKIEAMSPTMEVYAMLQYHLAPSTFRAPLDPALDAVKSGEFKDYDLKRFKRVTRTVKLVGVDPRSRTRMGGFKEHLTRMKTGAEPNFELPPDQQTYQIAKERKLLAENNPAGNDPLLVAPPSQLKIPTGIIVGNLIPNVRVLTKDDKTITDRAILPGDDVVIYTVCGGEKIAAIQDRLVVVDFFASEMSEYDSNLIYVPLDYLQRLRSMEGRVTSIQIKLKNYDSSAKEVVARLKDMFPFDNLSINTWEDKQVAILAAISIEKGILNVLLFLIIAVAGFGILAIFSMIVAEKTRDIGILKALGASNGGVMKIFLGYGLLLGLVGSGLGSSIGVALSVYINQIEQWLTRMTGQEVFNRNVYYFEEIPVDIQPLMLILVNIGAVFIAVLFSVLPALRAALLHPVRALRYE